MKIKIHVIAATLALATICSFWLSTLVSEALGDHTLITTVKTGVLYGMFLLIPSMAIAGATGASMGRGWKLPQVARKSRRMKLIAANGLAVLLPSAFFLASLAQAGNFGGLFYGIQALELVAGATNIILLSMNMRDGLSLRARRRARS